MSSLQILSWYCTVISREGTSDSGTVLAFVFSIPVQLVERK